MPRLLALTTLCLTLSGCAFVLDFDGFEVGEGTDGGGLDGGTADAGDAMLPDGLVPDGCVPTGDETCNGMDDDCNGIVDDVRPLPSDAENCGMCGFSCRTGYACVDRGCHDEVVDIAGGGDFTCVKLRGGQVWCFGANDRGQLGVGTTTESEAAARQLTDLTTAGDVGAGVEHACAITGITRCWGANDSGQLADESATDSSSPVDTNGDSAVEVVAGESHSCIRTTAGGVECAGDNSSGQLGRSLTTTDLPRFSEIAGLAAVRDLAAGWNHNCAISGSAGTLSCWGDNGSGQVGVPSTTPVVPAPSPITLVARVVDVTAGGAHTCVVLEGGDVQCWGENGRGQLGNGSNDDSSSRQDVDLPGPARAIAAGESHTCAVVEDGSETQVWCWGDNDFGQLGNRMKVASNVPVQAEGITRAREVIGAGTDHTCVAVLADRPELRCWGNNRMGQLGTGSTATPESTIPTESLVPTE